MGTIKTSDPAPAAVPTVPAKYTPVRAADCEAIGIFVLKVLPVPCWMRFPESEAKKREPLLKILSAPSLEEAAALNGLEGEGRDVESVSLAAVRDAASLLP